MGQRLSFYKRPFAYLLLACSTLFYLPLGLRALWDSDEGRYAEIAREMLELKDWITPHLNYVRYFEKPPLMYWLTALSLRLLGPNAFAARFGCATFGLLTVGLVYRWGKRWKNERTGLLAGAILATSLGFFILTQFLVLDMALTFWTTFTLMAASGLLVERSPKRSRRFLYLAAIGVSGGVLTKGPVALVLPAAAFGIVYFMQDRRVPLAPLPWGGAALLGAMLTLPWFIAVSLRNPVFPSYFLIHEHLERYLTNVHHRAQPVYFFVPVLLAGFLPWSVFLPRVACTWFENHHAAMRRDPQGAVMVVWTCLVFVFFSLSHSKLAGYVMPVFPMLALLLAHEFDAAADVGDAAAPDAGLMPAWIGQGLAALILVFFAGLLALKLPPAVLSISRPEWAVVVDQGGFLALILGFGVFVFVGVWGMRQTLTGIAAVMLVQVLLLSSAASLAPEVDPYMSTRLLAARFNAHAAPGESLVGYGVAYENVLQTLPFYLARRVPVYGDPGELQLGFEQAATSSPWFVPEEKASQAVLALPSGSWGITDRDHWQALSALAAPGTFQPGPEAGNLLLFRKAR